VATLLGNAKPFKDDRTGVSRSRSERIKIDVPAAKVLELPDLRS
jgi:hypothetical protein